MWKSHSEFRFYYLIRGEGNAASYEECWVYPTNFTPLRLWEVEEKMKGWEAYFDWSVYFSLDSNVKVFKLTILGDDEVIQRAVAIEIKQNHIFVNLVESAPHNRGKERVFKHVGVHLFAYACFLTSLGEKSPSSNTNSV